MRSVGTRGGKARGAVALAALMCAIGTMPVAATTVASVQVADRRIVIRFDAPVADAASLIAADSRQILVQVRDTTPGDGGRVAGPVSRIRQSRRDGGTRIAFTLAEPTVVGTRASAVVAAN